jgi:hypothetical protein
LPGAKAAIVCNGILNSRKSASKKAGKKYFNFF